MSITIVKVALALDSFSWTKKKKVKFFGKFIVANVYKRRHSAWEIGRKISGKMGLWLNPLPRGQLATSACFFVAGVSLFGVGAYLSYVNIGPQQARTIARDNFVKERLRKRHHD